MENENKSLTNLEVVAELRTRVKPYHGIMAQASFSQRCIAIENGTAKPITVQKFFGHFGYTGTYNDFTLKQAN